MKKFLFFILLLVGLVCFGGIKYKCLIWDIGHFSSYDVCFLGKPLTIKIDRKIPCFLVSTAKDSLKLSFQLKPETLLVQTDFEQFDLVFNPRELEDLKISSFGRQIWSEGKYEVLLVLPPKTENTTFYLKRIDTFINPPAESFF